MAKENRRSSSKKKLPADIPPSTTPSAGTSATPSASTPAGTPASTTGAIKGRFITKKIDLPDDILVFYWLAKAAFPDYTATGPLLVLLRNSQVL